jgi:hypothetical protein
MEQQISQEVISRSIYDQDLEYLVNVVERANIDIGVTLLVKGLLVSGMLVSNKKYYTQVGDDLQSAGGIGASVAEYFTKRAESFDVEKPEYSEPSFMNLIKVSFLKGDGHMGSMKGACLRLKIEEVDGYFLGSSQFE